MLFYILYINMVDIIFIFYKHGIKITYIFP